MEGVAILIGVNDKFLKLTSSLDKLDKIGMDGVINELENQEFSKRSIDLLIPFLDNKGSFKSKIDFLSRKLKDIEVAKEGLDDLFSIYSKINKFKLNCISVNLDINLARGLDYYTGLILEVVPDKGEFDFGSIAGGGRYDNLTDFFGLKDTSGFGISFGFDRISLMLEKLKLFPKDLSKSSKVCLLILRIRLQINIFKNS